MSVIFGALGLNDNERVFAGTGGQEVIYSTAVDYINQANTDLAAFLATFSQGMTEKYKQRYKLPGGGQLDRTGGQGPAPAARVFGSWDVAFPLEGFIREVAYTDVSRGYLTVGDFDLHIRGIIDANVRTVRFEMLKALFNDNQDTFEDEIHGSLSIEPLANGDTVVYPPVLGSETEATEDHYLESGYAASALSDINNPYRTIRDDITHHFGISTGGENLVVFVHGDQVAKTEDLSDFDPTNDRFTTPGANTDQLSPLPGVPGKIIGRTNSCWVVQWDWIPTAYMLGISLDEPGPLMMRTDPADTGLAPGLQLISEDEQYPFRELVWRHRFGFGAGNRLNGVVMELGTGGTYTIPTIYQ